MFQFNTIEEALGDLRQGKIILVTDDENRENEGDLICASEFATTENVNFMAVHGKGLICMPMSIGLCQKLRFSQMVSDNTDNHKTAFAVSVDHVSTTTGISAEERGITARACVSENGKPDRKAGTQSHGASWASRATERQESGHGDQPHHPHPGHSSHPR